MGRYSFAALILVAVALWVGIAILAFWSMGAAPP